MLKLSSRNAVSSNKKYNRTNSEIAAADYLRDIAHMHETGWVDNI